jgi:hypothetical protein
MNKAQYTALVTGAHQYWGLTEQDVINALTAKFGPDYNLGAIGLNQGRIVVTDFAMNARDVPADPALETALEEKPQ